jgi:thioredoxin reductase (NADPH)
MKVEVVVIGAGPAGVACAVQLARLSIPVVLVERSKVGGLARNASRIENLLSFPNGISGSRFATLLKKQLARWQVPTRISEALNIEKTRDGFSTYLSNGETIRSKFLVLATGTVPRKLGVKGEESLISQKKAFYEVVHTPKKWRKVLVIGGGDAAFDYSITLALRSKKAIILTRKSPRTFPLLVERALAMGIEIVEGVEVKKLAVSEDGVLALSSKEEFFADGLLIAAGRIPNDGLLESFKPISVNFETSETNIEGLYLCGTVHRPSDQRYIAVAASDALLAASCIAKRRG